MTEQSGQAILEYLFVLITVLLMLAAFYQLSTGFQIFARGYFGPDGYLDCLLKSGELPTTLGVDSPGDKNSETCAAKFEAFALGETKKLDFRTSSSNVNPTSSSSSGGTGNTFVPTPYVPSGSPTSSSQASGGGGGLDGSNRAGSDGGGSRLTPAGSNMSSADNLKSRNVPATESDLSGSKNGSGQKKGNLANVNERRLEQQGEGGGRKRLIPPGQDIKGQIEEDALRMSRIPASQNDLKPGGRKVAIDPLKKATASGDEPWTLGDFIKYLLIAAILIALVLFFGGQVLQFSKGQE